MYFFQLISQTGTLNRALRTAHYPLHPTCCSTVEGFPYISEQSDPQAAAAVSRCRGRWVWDKGQGPQMVSSLLFIMKFRTAHAYHVIPSSNTLGWAPTYM